MTTLTPTAPLFPSRIHIRPAHLRIALPLLILLACAVLFGRLAGAAFAAPSPTVAPSPVSIATTGKLAVDGLASGGSTVSTLTVTNNSAGAVRWAAHPTTTGTTGVADKLAMQVYVPTAGSCAASGNPVSLRTPSAAPLAPGESVSVCVVLSMPTSGATKTGTVTPGLAFTGTPA